ncbi:MAG: NAD(P)-dependent oxidoreductase [Anaerolineae bacterium]|nr:NAD(P)-dependent oxidoreductase [Anaerolineae bacterium]
MSRILVTGASGRFAPYMIQALQADHELLLTSRTAPAKEHPSLPWLPADLNVYDDCRRVVEGVAAIMHLGAVPFPSDHPEVVSSLSAAGRELPPFDATMRTNLLGTYNLMMAAVEAGVRVVVMTGSNCAFGHGYRISERPFPIKYLPLDEEHPTDVEDSYSYSKLAGEELLAAFARAYGVRTYVTRPGGICPPERLQRMASQVAPPTAWSQWMWGYVPSEDLAEMQRLILEQSDQLPSHAVFVANGLDTTLMEPTREVIARLRPDLMPLAEGLDGYQALFSTTKAQLMLGWTPKRSWRDDL